jgi:hypothetical protein
MATYMPPRQKTYHPDSVVPQDISIDEQSDRILLSGLSFDHVCFDDGYIMPCVEPAGESQQRLTDEVSKCQDTGCSASDLEKEKML